MRGFGNLAQWFFYARHPVSGFRRRDALFYAASGILSLSKDEWRFDKLSAPGRVIAQRA